MQILRGELKEDPSRDLFWTRLVFSSDDKSHKTQLLVCASDEYLSDLYEVSGGPQLTPEQFDDWLNSVVDKWSSLGIELFHQDTHYDVYANTPEGEANGLDFLLNKSRLD